MIAPSTYTSARNTPRFGQLPDAEQGGIEDMPDYFSMATSVPPAEQAGVTNGNGVTPTGAVTATVVGGVSMLAVFAGVAQGTAFWVLARKGYVPAWAGYSLGILGYVSALANLGFGAAATVAAAAHPMAGYGDYVQLPYSGYRGYRGYGDYVQLPYSGYRR